MFRKKKIRLPSSLSYRKCHNHRGLSGLSGHNLTIDCFKFISILHIAFNTIEDGRCLVRRPKIQSPPSSVNKN